MYASVCTDVQTMDKEMDRMQSIQAYSVTLNVNMYHKNFST